MKKLLLIGSLIATNSLFAITDEQILNFYAPLKDRGIEVKIGEKSQIANGKFQQIVLEFTTGAITEKAVIFTDGEYILTDVIDPRTKESYSNSFIEKQRAIDTTNAHKKLAKLLKKTSKSNIITIGNDKNKPVKYIFTDPNCPYCQMALENIEKELENFNLKLILTPIPSHGEDAVKKSVAIYNETKKLKKDADKIAVFRKYYAKDAKAPENITQKQIQAAQKVIDEFFATGAIGGVPTMIEESELNKLK